MTRKFLAAIILAGGLAAGALPAFATEPHAASPQIRLSPELLELLQAEMREIAGGVQAIAVALATADWESIEATGTRIRTSYIMDKQLDPSRRRELELALPERFKQLDAQFHRRAERLVEAAAAADAELAAFHYSRLLEDCARCHAEFASARFPGFTAPAPQEHHH